jgi:hypothetical protein
MTFALGNDTHPSIAKKQLEILRAKTPEQRMRLAIAQSVYLINLSRAELEKKMSKIEAKICWVRINYGETLAMNYRQALSAKEQTHEYQ